LTARRDAFEPNLPGGGDALRALDVTLLGVALDRLAGTSPDAVAAGAVAYSKSASEAIARVDDSSDGADAVFLLESTPVAAISAVARDGDVMPQKSTYFYPKALTGLVINPHEW
jgi:predicted acylesterase/phospholipase RssA